MIYVGLVFGNNVMRKHNLLLFHYTFSMFIFWIVIILQRSMADTNTNIEYIIFLSRC
jgi:hypothetical protein